MKECWLAHIASSIILWHGASQFPLTPGGVPAVLHAYLSYMYTDISVVSKANSDGSVARVARLVFTLCAESRNVTIPTTTRTTTPLSAMYCLLPLLLLQLSYYGTFKQQTRTVVPGGQRSGHKKEPSR
jgi:hypothetical protein